MEGFTKKKLVEKKRMGQHIFSMGRGRAGWERWGIKQEVYGGEGGKLEKGKDSHRERVWGKKGRGGTENGKMKGGLKDWWGTKKEDPSRPRGFKRN